MAEHTGPLADTTGKARSRGRPPRISRAEVVEAAGALDPDELTVQAVADRLGVTRSAIYHYVDSSEDLLRLTVRHADAPFGPDDLDETSWRAWLSGFATECRRWRLAQGEAVHRVVITPTDLPWLLEVVDHGIAVLEDAGFAPTVAGHALHFVAGLVWINTHDEIVARTSAEGRHPQGREIATAVAGQADRLPHLAGYRGEGPFGDSDARFAREIGWALDALQIQLDREGPS